MRFYKKRSIRQLSKIVVRIMFNKSIKVNFFPMNLINITNEVIHMAVEDIENAIAVPRDIFGMCTKKGLKNKISAPLQKYMGIPINMAINVAGKLKLQFNKNLYGEKYSKIMPIIAAIIRKGNIDLKTS